MTVAEQLRAEEGLGDALKEYAGRWVAIRDYAVIAHAETLEALLEQIEPENEDETLVLQVAEDEAVACFF